MKKKEQRRDGEKEKEKNRDKGGKRKAGTGGIQKGKGVRAALRSLLNVLGKHAS